VREVIFLLTSFCYSLFGFAVFTENAGKKPQDYSMNSIEDSFPEEET